MKKFIILLVMALFVPVVAKADAVSDRLAKLEKMIKDMNTDSISRNEKAAKALSELELLKHDIQSVQGTIDANNHILKGQQEDIQKFKRDISERMMAIENRFEVYDIQMGKALSKVVPNAVNETEAYQKGLDLVQKGDFLTAVASFRSFLKANPNSKLADNAQYWIGECYYAIKDHQKAIKEFQVLIEKHPRSDKVKTAILKQGLSFADLGMTDEARAFLEQVIKTYPGSEEATRAREKLDKLGQKVAPDSVAPLSQSQYDSHSSIPLASGVKKQPPKQPEKEGKRGQSPGNREK